MAYTVQFFQDQVHLITGHDGLNTNVIRWLDRACQDIGIKAVWKQQVQSGQIGGVSQTSTLTSQWVSLTTNAATGIVALQRVEYGSTRQLVRQEIEDLYANFHGITASYSAGDVRAYAIPKWTTSGNATTRYMVPQFAVYPINATATASTAMTAYWLTPPARIAQTTDSNWIMDKYPLVVLARIMCYVGLYLKNPNIYLLWKSRYENGVADMTMTEETSLASRPALRGIVPEVFMRGGR